MIDEYEEDELPVDLLDEIALEIRNFAETDRDAKLLRSELSEIVDFLERARRLNLSVWVIL